jgi:hypothetical protein
MMCHQVTVAHMKGQPMKPAAAAMRDDLQARLKELGEGSMDDLSVELLLRAWEATLTREELMEGCYAVLMAGASPPWMSATSVAVRMIYEDAGDAKRLWERVMAVAPRLGSRDLAGWIYGHNYRRYDGVTFERFVRMGDVVSAVDRMGIAVMLSTWSGYGTDAEVVMGYIDKVSGG